MSSFKKVSESSVVCEESCTLNLMCEKGSFICCIIFPVQAQNSRTCPWMSPLLLGLVGWEVAGGDNLFSQVRLVTSRAIAHPGGCLEVQFKQSNLSREVSHSPPNAAVCLIVHGLNYKLS